MDYHAVLVMQTESEKKMKTNEVQMIVDLLSTTQKVSVKAGTVKLKKKRRNISSNQEFWTS